MDPFPYPFAGITTAVRLTGLKAERAVPLLIGTPKKDGGCGHKHNVAYASSEKTLYVSALGAECLNRVLRDLEQKRKRGRH